MQSYHTLIFIHRYLAPHLPVLKKLLLEMSKCGCEPQIRLSDDVKWSCCHKEVFAQSLLIPEFKGVSQAHSFRVLVTDLMLRFTKEKRSVLFLAFVQGSSWTHRLTH